MAGQLMLVNPRKRRRRRTTTKRRKSPARRLSTVTTRTIKRYRRNPSRRRGAGQMMETFMGGMIGAGGALAVDFAMKQLPIPATLTANPLMAAATRGFVGIGLGMLVRNFGGTKGKKIGEQLAGGATTVALYTAGKGMFGAQLGLNGLEDGLLGYDDGLLGYSDFGDDGMGWIDAEQVSPWDNSGMGAYSEFDE